MKRLFDSAINFAKKKPLATLAGFFVLAIIGYVVMLQTEKYPTIACSPCHVMDPYVVGYFDEELLSKRHHDANVNCVDCHENGIEDKILMKLFGMSLMILMTHREKGILEIKCVSSATQTLKNL